MKFSSALFRLYVAVGGALTIPCIQSATAQVAVSPQSMKVLGEVDPRFVSYNVEAVEVTGGRFWAPYKSAAQKAAAAASKTHSGNQPAGLDSNLFEYRPPIAISRTRNSASSPLRSAQPTSESAAPGATPPTSRITTIRRLRVRRKASTVSSRARSGRASSTSQTL